jgi:hypothetical protein
LLVSVIAFILFAYPPLRDEWRLSTAIAEADRLDPGWRWQEILARRRVVPHTENSALKVIQAYKLLPEPWDGGQPWEAFRDSSYELDLHPNFQLNSIQINGVREKFSMAPIAALAEALAVAEMPVGRYEVDTEPSPFKKGPHLVQKPQKVSELLRLHMYLREAERDLDAALLSCRAIINVGRSFGDEPDLISFSMRTGLHAQASSALQRSLAQGEPSEAALLAMQRQIAMEELEPILLRALRRHRAALHRYLDGVRSGEYPDAPILKAADAKRSFDKRSGSDEPNWKTGWQPADEWLERWRDEPLGAIKAGQGALLQYMNGWVEDAKDSVHLERLHHSALDEESQKLPLFVRILTGDRNGRWAHRYLRSRAALRCTIAALAVERYRLAHGRWPGSLEQLVPAYLAEVPADPFVNHQLRIVRKPDGVVVYSVGLDSKDDGGDVLGTSEKRPDDIGFRLWDLDKRRQAPMPVPKKIESEVD